MKPLSVLIDTYNHEKYIEQAVVSAIEQNFPASDYEIVVVDDGSTDRTPDIVQKFAPRVRLLRKKNGGQASAFNAAIPELRGQAVAFLDGDDWFAPGKLTAVMDALREHPEAAAVSHGYYEVYDDTGVLKLRVPPHPKFMHLSTADAARQASIDWPFLIVGALTVRSPVLDRILPIPEKLTFLADAPIALAAMAAGTYVFPQALCYYRKHSDNLFAVDSVDAVRFRRRQAMSDAMFDCLERELLGLGVRREAVRVFIHPRWVALSRSNLRDFDRRRFHAFLTEMRAFRLEHTRPRFGYLLFKYMLVGAATLVLPPRQFYKLRDWYGRRNLGSLRERFARAGHENRATSDGNR